MKGIAGIRKNKYLWIAGALAFLLFYYIFDPIESGWMPQCLFHKVTGLHCMGCGSQRVLHNLLHGDLQAAFKANAFLVLSLPFLIFLIYLELSRSHYPRLYSKIHSLPMIVTITAMLVAWLFVRNIFGI